jgi:hypothetical protein
MEYLNLTVLKELNNMSDDEDNVNENPDDDIDFDIDLESIDDEEDNEEPLKTEEGKPQKEITEADKELESLRRERDELREKAERLAAEREEAVQETEKANRVAVQNLVSQWEDNIKKEKSSLNVLNEQLEEARIDGDLERIKAIRHAIVKSEEVIDGFKGEINKYSPLLAERKSSQKPQESLEDVMANEWVADNPWLTDPKFKEKRDKVKELAKQLVEDGYSKGSRKFWNFLDEKLAEFDKPPVEKLRREPPATRPVTNNNTNRSVMSGKQKADKEIVAKVDSMLAARGIVRGDEPYEKLRKSYYNTVSTLLNKEARNA